MCKEETIRGLDSGKLIAVPKWTFYIKNVSVVFVLTVVFYMGVEITSIKAVSFDSPRQKEKVISMTENKTVHMTYQEKIKVFVPRSEIQYKLDNINDKLDELIEFKNGK